jgi:hypothetical protein
MASQADDVGIENLLALSGPLSRACARVSGQTTGFLHKIPKLQTASRAPSLIQFLIPIEI